MSSSTKSDDRWSISTNWTIAGGSLSSSISVDSTLQEQEQEQIIETPLILTPPSSPSEPCQITITFTQKQDVHQVYVRSTARVYEIYSARSLGSNNDYLCTIRCGIATRDDKVLHATDIEPVGAHLKDSTGEQEKENCSNSEDDWVEVKVLDMPLKDDRDNVVCEKNGVNPRTNLQDLYEATAEFNDSDACTSLTLRLLSLQTKAWISIDEIYVFADPAESEAQEAPVGNSLTTSLMSMLVPTLLQLSKSSNAHRQNLHAPNSSENGEYLDVGSKVDCSTVSENELEQENIEAVTKPPDIHIAKKESGTGQIKYIIAQTDGSTNCVENVLEQLVSRVSRIEDICLRFEENMLNPIKTMEQRLQMVEEQVQVLVRNSQQTKLPSYTRICAPEFSCGESNSSSFYTEGNENPSFGEVDLKKKDTTSEKEPNLSNAKFHPGLAISAPEFFCHDDEENNDGDYDAKDGAIRPFNDCPQEKPRQVLSIDAALAAALSGFMANTSVQPAHYTQALTVKAPEFTIEEDGNDEMAIKQKDNSLVPPIINNKSYGTECKDSVVSGSSKFRLDENSDDIATKPNENPSVPPIIRGESNGIECKNGVVSGSPAETHGHDKLVIDCISCSRSEQIECKNGVISGSPDRNNGQDKLVIDCINCSRSEPELEFAHTDGSQIADSTGVVEIGDVITNLVSVKNDILDAVSENTGIEVGKRITENATNLVANCDSQNADSIGGEEPSDEATISVYGKNRTVEECSGNTEVELEKSSLGKSIDSPWASCVVDFELPILDVKFTSSGFSSATSSLEALFDNVEASSMEQTNKDEKNDSFSNNPSSYNKFLLDCEVNDASYGATSLEGEALYDSFAHDKQDSFLRLL